jgi:hypothetical protein
MAAFLLSRFGLDGYEQWKQMFDSDPVGRKQAASGHRIFQNVDDPNDVFIGVEFASAEEAKSFRERLLASDVLDRVSVKVEPTVVESVDEARY